jgi:hypothetical protein
MKSFTTKQLESTASPLYEVTIVDTDDSIITLTLAINKGDDLDKAVNEAYDSIKNPAQPKPLTYAQKRQPEYPPVTDYLDGIVKGDTAQVQAYIDACNAVKAKYPKV